MIAAAAWLRLAFRKVSDKITPLLFIAILGVVAWRVGSWVTASLAGCPSRTPSLLSLELSFSAERLARLKALAGSCSDAVEASFVHWDLLFPWCYAAALCALVIWTERWIWTAVADDSVRNEAALRGTAGSTHDRLAACMMLAPWLAAILDVFGENLPLYLLWDHLGPSPTLTTRALVVIASLCAAAKWTLVGAVVIWFVVLLLAGPRGWVLWRTRFSALAVLLGSVPLLVNDQGQDVLASIAETRAKQGLLPGVGALLLGAFAAWWCARVLVLLHLPDEVRPSDQWERYFEKEIPRILGVVVMALGAAALARAAGDDLLIWFAGGGLGLLAVTGLLRLRWGIWFERLGKLLLRWLRLGELQAIPDLAADIGHAVVTLALFSLILSRWHPAPTDDAALLRAAYALRWAVWLATVLAVAFYIYAYHRRNIWVVVKGYTIALADQQLEGYPPAQTPPLTRWVAAGAALLSLLFFLSFLYRDSVTVGQKLGAFFILCLAAANAVLIGSATVFVGRVLRLPLVTIAIVFAILFSRWKDNHAVPLIPGPAPARPALGQYYGQWLRNRAATAGQDAVPVVLVAASGGGLRAAYWTAHSLSVLSDREPAFAKSVFAISGVSGGSLGGAVYASLVRDREQSSSGPCFAAGGRAPLTTCSHTVLGADFLSPILARLVATDFTQSFLPWPWSRLDRSRAIEASWTEAYAKATGDSTFGAGFLQLWRSDTLERRVPALLLNATHVETGRRLVASPFPVRGVLQDSYDLFTMVGADLRLASAVHNSARFTYVSPAGTLEDTSHTLMGHAVDGGYFENSGLATVSDLYSTLTDRSFLASASPRLDSIPQRFVVLYLCNDPIACEAEQAEPVAAPVKPALVTEWAAPIRALLDTREARGSLARAEMASAASAALARGDSSLQFFELDVCADSGFSQARDSASAERAVEPAAERAAKRVRSPPLGWVLSPSARHVIERSLTGKAACPSRNRERMDALLRSVVPGGSGGR